MMRRNRQAATLSTALELSRAAALSAGDGVAFGGDNQRTGWARDERSITAVYCFGVRRD